MTRRWVSALAVLPVLFVLLPRVAAPVTVSAQTPVRREQLVYSILAFNGRDYAPTFAPEEADTLYLLADVDSFLTVRKTFVFFWPITQQWMTDTWGLNIPFDGTLEVLGERREKRRRLEPTVYTYYNARGDYEFNWVVVKGEEAHAAVQRYRDLMDAYVQSVEDYHREYETYELILRRLTDEVTRMREEGEDPTELVQVLQHLMQPREPQYPQDYIVPPAEVSEAFVVNLPAGEYWLRFLTPDGHVMQGSERRLVVFRERRAEGTGLEVIPAVRWTRPVESKTPASVLYVDGSSDLYLRPFHQHEYNDLYYEKLRRNDAKGNPNLMKWVRIQQVPHALISVSRSGGEPVFLREEPFYVEQTGGAALGYRIVPFDPEGAHRDQNPSLVAFHLVLTPRDRVVHVQILDRHGESLEGGARQVRVVRPGRAGLVSLILAVQPLLVMAVVLVLRSRVYMRAGRPDHETRQRRASR